MQTRTWGVALLVVALIAAAWLGYLLLANGPGTAQPKEVTRRDDAAAERERPDQPVRDILRAGAPAPTPVDTPPVAPTILPDGGLRYGLDKDGLRAALGSAMPEIDACYEAWLKAQPTLGARFNVRFTVDTDDGVEGHVTQVSTGDGGTGNLAFEGCVRSVVAALRFEPPLDGARELSYPFRFVAPPPAPVQREADLPRLCQRIRHEALRPEHASVSPDSLLTTVLIALERQTPSLQNYFAALLPGDVPPLQRRETFKRAISSATGAPWACPEFDTLWDGKRIER